MGIGGVEPKESMWREGGRAERFIMKPNLPGLQGNTHLKSMY